MSNEAYQLGLEALDVTDQYLNDEVSSSRAISKLDGICEDLENMYNEQDDSDSLDGISTSFNTLTLKMNISAISFAMEIHSYGDASYTLNDIKDKRDELAESLNKPSADAKKDLPWRVNN
jgi:hypothetical protein